MIGLKRGTVKLVKPRAIWQENFEREAKKLKKVFGKEAIGIQHVGSTAIPSIPAKPIVDIAVVTPSLKKARRYSDAVKRIGYTRKKEKRSDRLFFTKGPEKKRTHHLHVGEAGSGYVEDMILFRDYLRKNKKVAREYAKLKVELAGQYPDKRYVYTAKKEKFIKTTVTKAKKSLRHR